MRAVARPMARFVLPLPGDDLVPPPCAPRGASGVELVGRDATARRADGVEQRRPADAGRRPQHDLAVAVLADDGGVHAVDGDAETLGQQVAQPRRVEHRAAAEHPPGGSPLISWATNVTTSTGLVTSSTTASGRHARAAAAARRGRGRRWPRRGPSGSAGAVGGAGGDDDEVGTGAHGDVVAPVDPAATDELQTVAQIEHLGPGARAVDVVQGDLVGDAVDHAGVGDGGPDAARPDHGDLVQPGDRLTVATARGGRELFAAGGRPTGWCRRRRCRRHPRRPGSSGCSRPSRSSCWRPPGRRAGRGPRRAARDHRRPTARSSTPRRRRSCCASASRCP